MLGRKKRNTQPKKITSCYYGIGIELNEDCPPVVEKIARITADFVKDILLVSINNDEDPVLMLKVSHKTIGGFIQETFPEPADD